METTRNRRGWELEELMYQRRIRTAADLARRLRKLGVDMTSVHLARLIKTPPRRLSVELLEALSTVLSCTLDELMPVVGAEPVPEPQEVRPVASTRRLAVAPNPATTTPRAVPAAKETKPTAAPQRPQRPILVEWNGDDDDIPVAPAYPPEPEDMEK